MGGGVTSALFLLPRPAGRDPSQLGGGACSPRARAVDAPRGGSGKRQGRGQFAPLDGGTAHHRGGHDLHGSGVHPRRGRERTAAPAECQERRAADAAPWRGAEVPTARPQDHPNRRHVDGVGVTSNRRGSAENESPLFSFFRKQGV